MNLTKYFIENSKLRVFTLLFIVVIGLINILTLPRQDLPNVDFNVFTISTYYPGASPLDVEINVTDPIEDELESIDDIEDINSYSLEGMSFISMKVDSDAKDVQKVRSNIQSAIDRVNTLPKEIETPPLLEDMTSTDFPLLEIAIVGKDISEKELRKVAKDIEADLKTVSDVGKIDKIGYRKREVKILCDINKMQSEYISFADIMHSISTRNIRDTGGTVESFVNEKNIVTFAEFEEPSDVGEVIIRGNFFDKILRIKDIAEIKDDYKKRDIYCRTNGFDSINLVVKRKGVADVIDLSKNISVIVDKYNKLLGSRGIKVIKLVDYTYYTKSLLDILKSNAGIGFILVILSLFLFLNLRTAFWVSCGVPVSIFGAYILFPFFNITTDQISVISLILVLGMLVDDAIIIGENITRHIESGLHPKEAAILGVKEVFRPILTTIATTILCFGSLFFMTGILGKFIFAIPVVIILALLMSLFESTCLLPAHLAKGKRTMTKEKVFRKNIILFLQKHYTSLLKICLKNRLKVLLVFCAILVFSGIFFKFKSKFVLFPSTDYDIFFVEMETKLGDSLLKASKKMKTVEKAVNEISKDIMMGFKTIVGNHTTDESEADPTLRSHWGIITVFLRPASKRNITSEALMYELKQSLKAVQGFSKLEVRPMQDGPPVGRPITIRLVSDDFDLCAKYEKQIFNVLKSVKGVHSLDTSNKNGKKEVRLKLKHEIMAKTGVTALDVASGIRMAYDGIIATSIRKDGEEIDFRIQLNQEQRGNIDLIKNIQIMNNENRLIKIGSLFYSEEVESIENMRHYNGRRAIVITGDVNNEIITSKEVNKIVMDKFSDKISMEHGLSLIFGGEEKETQESMKNFFIAFVCSIIGIYFILTLLLNSYLQPLLIMVAIPFGLVGVFIAFYLHNMPISFLGIIGALGMIGVVVNDSLVMVTYLNLLKEKYGKMNFDIIIEGSTTRLRPVLLTTITTVAGLVPTVYGIGGTEPFIVPMVLAMSWGLAFATGITLVLVPVLYSVSLR